MNERNVLKEADSNVINFCCHLSESEIAEDMRMRAKFFDGIPEYRDGEVPSEDDIKTAEKVLKYATKCKYIGFTEDDAHLVMGCSTNILRWSLCAAWEEANES